jgi:hypothetical protein
MTSKPEPPADPAVEAVRRREAQERSGEPDRQAGQEADRIETMQRNLREGYGRDRRVDDIEREKTSEGSVPRDVAERHGEHGHT